MILNREQELAFAKKLGKSACLAGGSSDPSSSKALMEYLQHRGLDEYLSFDFHAPSTEIKNAFRSAFESVDRNSSSRLSLGL